MLALAGRGDVDPADALADGRAMDVWRRMIAAQGGDPDARLPVASHTEVISAPQDGYVVGMPARPIAVAAWRLGAGRARKEDPVDLAAGVQIHRKPGDRVTAGDPVLTLHTHDPAKLGRALESLVGAIEYGSEGIPTSSTRVIDRIV
jgi:thymidine phosphorylase